MRSLEARDRKVRNRKVWARQVLVPKGRPRLAHSFSGGKDRRRNKSRRDDRMSHSYASNRIHMIFSTKNREKCLREDIQPKLWVYIAGIARNHKFEAIEIGGAEDHCHALIL